MDTDHDGAVTIQEWCNFLETTHAEKRKKKKGTGDKVAPGPRPAPLSH